MLDMHARPEAWILSIGNELLVGRIVNTNASWLARRLTFMGFNVSRIITIPDSIDDIALEVRRGLGKVRVIITTGGLGPTHDDVTLEGIAKALNKNLILNSEAYEMIKEFYNRRNMPLTRERIKMAYMPEGARALRNPIGSAPGCIIEVDSTIIVSLPGVPREMEAIFEEEVKSILEIIAPKISIVECSLKTRGIPESSIAPFLEHIAKSHSNVYVKSHPLGFELDKPILELRVLVSATSEDTAKGIARSIMEDVIREVLKLGGSTSSEYCV
ncbi:MAG: nicotinamide mononucleotide deamidase-related protein [Acidilobaceae archaeon]